jgi:hypothetical protein
VVFVVERPDIEVHVVSVRVLLDVCEVLDSVELVMLTDVAVTLVKVSIVPVMLLSVLEVAVPVVSVVVVSVLLVRDSVLVVRVEVTVPEVLDCVSDPEMPVLLVGVMVDVPVVLDCVGVLVELDCVAVLELAVRLVSDVPVVVVTVSVTDPVVLN